MIQEKKDKNHISEQFEKQKEIYFYKFLNLKVAFQQILHRKIVQHIFKKYTEIKIEFILEDQDQIEESFKYCVGKLTEISIIHTLEILDYSDEWEIDEENMEFLSKEMIYLNQLKSLTVFTPCNEEFGFNEINYLNLGKMFKNIPQLRSLKLNLLETSLGENNDNLHNFVKGLQYLEKSLEYLDLNLDGNILQNNFYILTEGLKKLKKLKSINMDLQRNDLGKNQENLHFLYEGLQELKNLKSLQLCFKWNSFKNINEFLWKLFGLRYLECIGLDLSYNKFGGKEEKFQLLEQNSQDLQGLKKFSLDLSSNSFGENSVNIRNLGQSLKKFTGLKSLDLSFEKIKFVEGGCEVIKSFMMNFCVFEKIQYLGLKFSNNYFGKNNDNLVPLGQGFKSLKLNYLESLDLDLSGNYFGESGHQYEETMKFLGEGIQEFKNLKKLKLSLSKNCLVDLSLFFKQIFKNKQFLEILSLDLTSNEFQWNVMENLEKELQKLDSLKELQIDIRRNCLDFSVEDFKLFMDQMSCLSNLKKVFLDIRRKKIKIDLVKELNEKIQQQQSICWKVQFS